MRILGALAFLLLAWTGPGRAAAQRAPGPSIPDEPPPGWLIPEDSADALFEFSNLVIVHPRVSGPYPANVVLIAFRPGATRAQKRRAIDAVGGTLIGGDGVYYYIRVDRTCADRPVWCAIDILEKRREVEEAHPLLYGGFAPGIAIPVPSPDG
jgi:hypothetical protein